MNKKEVTIEEVLNHIETGITATGQKDSYCVGFCNALVWLNSCITHEEPHFFEDVRSNESDAKLTVDAIAGLQAENERLKRLSKGWLEEKKMLNEKLEKIEQIVNEWNNDASNSFGDMCKINRIMKGEIK